MGNLFREVELESTVKRVTQLEVIVSKLTGEDRNDFIDLLNDSSVSASALARVMQRRGYTINRHSIMDYRNKSFRFEKEGKRK
jgi:hypothetical protein